MNPTGKAEGKAGALRRFSALWLVLPAAGVLAVVSRSSPFYAVNNWSDAQCFFLMGKAMAQGRMLYVDAVDQKGPLLFLLHCIANWVEADGFLGVWLIEIAAAALFLYFARRLFLLCGAGRAAALAPALVLAVSYSTIAFQKGDSAEELCLPLLLGGVVLGLETLRLRRPLTLRLGLALGLLCGGAFWIKYNLCAPFAALAAGVGFAWWHAPNRQAFGQRREDAVQYQFAQVMRSVPDASYEMWGVLDRGFGMAADLLQASPYIGSFNLPVEQIQQEFYGEPAFDTEFIVCGSYEDEYEASLARWEPLLEQHGYARVGEGQERQLNRTTYYTVRYLLYQRQE